MSPPVIGRRGREPDTERPSSPWGLSHGFSPQSGGAPGRRAPWGPPGLGGGRGVIIVYPQKPKEITESDDGGDDGLKEIADRIAEAAEADVLLYAGPVRYPEDDSVFDLCQRRARRPNVILLLSTFGGDAHAAYRIARCLQRNYEKITVLIDRHCKSAGTLLALGSDMLVLSDYAELGPLDVQLMKDDDILERRSGLTPTQAVVSLAGLMSNTFQYHFLQLRLQMQLATKLSAQLASDMAIGVYKEIYGQIDPMRLGEIDRAMRIAEAYGERLVRGRGNAKRETLGTLLAGYPSHEFVIDRQEAIELFNCVRPPTDDEMELLNAIGGLMRNPPDKTTVNFLCSERSMETATEGADGKETRDDKEHARDSGPTTPGADPADGGPDRADGETRARSQGKGPGNGSHPSGKRAAAG